MPDYLFRGALKELDPDVYELTQLEAERQARKLILIASESTAPLAVREALTASDTRQKLLAENGFALRLPKAVQGYFWGARGELRPAWADLGLRAVAFEKQAEPQILLVSSQA